MKLCLYHGESLDGFASAWAVWASSSNLKDVWRFRPARYADIPRLTRWDAEDTALLHLLETAEETLFAGFVYPAGTMRAILDICPIVSVIDHHQSHRAELEPLIPCFRAVRLDPARCASWQTWEAFHPEEPIPEVLSYVDARVRSDFAAVPSDVHAVILALRGYLPGNVPYDVGDLFVRWNDIAHNLDPLRAEGRVLHRHYQTRVNEYAGTAAVWSFPDAGAHKDALLANCPGDFADDIGDALLNKGTSAPVAAAGVWTLTRHNAMRIRLRSVDGTALAIAKAYGGDGCANAAECTVAAHCVHFPERRIHNI